MKLLARAVIASAATIGLVAGLGGTAHAATQLGDYVQSCSDGEGHKGYMSYTTWKNVDKDRPNMTFMKAVTNKGTGGGKFRLETYRSATTADGSAQPWVGIAPDIDRAANNAYGTTKSITVTLGNEAWLYWPGARGTQNKQAAYKFHFLFDHDSRGGFESSCTLQIKRKS